MNVPSSKDHQYYDGDYRNPNRPFYDWFSLAINLPYTEEVFNEIMLGTNTENYNETAITDLIHEYIHYLQNFGSLWGIPKSIELVQSVLLIYNSLSGNDYKYPYPIDINTITEESLRKGFNNREKLKGQLKDFTKFNLINPAVEIRNYNINTQDEHFAVLINDFFQCNVCIKTLREGQAFLAEKLFLGYTDKELDQYIKKHYIITKAKVQETYFYWVLFDFLNSKYCNIKEITKGLFFLIQTCLNRANPCAAFRRFIIWLNSNNDRLMINIELIELIQEWNFDLIELKSKDISCKLTFIAIENYASLISKHRVNNEFLDLLFNIIDFLRTNMYEFNTGIFPYGFNFENLNDWYSVFNRFGTGILIFKNKVDDQKFILKTLGTIQHINNKQLVFNYLFIINLQIEMLLVEGDLCCPFKREFPICEIDVCEDSKYSCYSNAFLIDSEKTKDQMCFFENSALVMGFKKSIIF